MGSSSSRFGSGQSSQNNTSVKRTKRKFSSLLCGLPSSASHSVLEPESPISSVENLPPASVVTTSSPGVSFSIAESVCTSSKTSGADSESCNSSTKNSNVKYDCEKDANSREDKASTSFENPPIQEPVQGNVSLDLALAGETHNSVNGGIPSSSSDITSSSSIGQNHGNLNTEENTEENRRDVVRGADSDRGSVLVLSDSFLSLRMFGSGSTGSHPGLSDDESDMRTGGILLVDVVSISSNILSSGFSEDNSREARRSSGRFYFDALSRRNASRRRDFPSLAFAAGFGDDLGSDDRWLLDLSGDYDRHGRGHGFGYGYSRSHRRHEERRNFRSEMLERRLGGFDEHRTSLCASGLHPDGTCSCGSSFMDEEANPLGSISRIVLLAQALSEVLDELHRQPLSMSMLSMPASESLVDSFPLKSHKKMDASETGPNYVQQCYICLVDYEEGDKVRVLPCQHEYHAPCVDKWLKEVNGVCPVCRCNVSETPANALAQAAASSS